jgi:hypothetical protein
MGFGLPRGGLLPAAGLVTAGLHIRRLSLSLAVFLSSCIVLPSCRTRAAKQCTTYTTYSSKGRTEAKDGSGQGSPLFFFFFFLSILHPRVMEGVASLKTHALEVRLRIGCTPRSSKRRLGVLASALRTAHDDSSCLILILYWEMGSEPLFIPSSRCQKRGAELANLIMIHHPNGAFIGLVRSGPVRIARSRLWRPNTYVASRSVMYGRGVCTYVLLR